MITFDEFANVELRIGKVLTADAVSGSEKLLRLSVDLGEPEPRTIMSGIAKYYTPETLVGKQVVVAANLAPRSIMGVESRGMILAAGADAPVLLTAMDDILPGSLVR